MAVGRSRPWLTLGVAAAASGLVLMLAVPAAAAGGTRPAKGPAITVTPHTRLTNGQAVTVNVTGFPANATVAAIQCSPAAQQADCNVGGVKLFPINGSGSGSTTLVVKTGQVGTDASSLCPNPSGDCVVEAADIARPSIIASRAIGFAGALVSPSSGGPGVAVTVWGGGYRPGETVEVGYRLATSKIHICRAVADRVGDFTCTGSIPSASNAGRRGPHKIVATGKTSPTREIAIFTLT